MLTPSLSIYFPPTTVYNLLVQQLSTSLPSRSHAQSHIILHEASACRRSLLLLSRNLSALCSSSNVLMKPIEERRSVQLWYKVSNSESRVLRPEACDFGPLRLFEPQSPSDNQSLAAIPRDGYASSQGYPEYARLPQLSFGLIDYFCIDTIHQCTLLD